MTFKLITFALILIAIVVLGMRGYRAAVRRFETEAAARGVQKAVGELAVDEAAVGEASGGEAGAGRPPA